MERLTDIRFNSYSRQLPFLRKWFSHKEVTEFTVAVWYKRCSIDTRLEQGLVHNGGCLATNSGFQVTTGYGGVFAGITTSDPFPPGLKQLFAVTVEYSYWMHVGGGLLLFTIMTNMFPVSNCYDISTSLGSIRSR